MKTILLLLLPACTLYNCAVFGQSTSDSLVNQQKELAVQQQQIAKQNIMLEQQAAALKTQQANLAKQEVLLKEQAAQMKVQQKVKAALEQELLKDDLIKKNEHYELLINSKALFINKVKQPDAVHEKYIKLINNARNTPFGASEEWKINE